MECFLSMNNGFVGCETHTPTHAAARAMLQWIVSFSRLDSCVILRHCLNLNMPGDAHTYTRIRDSNSRTKLNHVTTTILLLLNANTRMWSRGDSQAAHWPTVVTVVKCSLRFLKSRGIPVRVPSVAFFVTVEEIQNNKLHFFPALALTRKMIYKEHAQDPTANQWWS